MPYETNIVVTEICVLVIPHKQAGLIEFTPLSVAHGNLANT